MVLFQQLLEPVQQHITLLIGQAVDELRVLPDRVETLPACDRVRADNRVHRAKLPASVLSGAARLLIDLKTTSIGGCDEVRPAESAREAFEEFLVGRRDAVVELVPGGPEGVTTGLGHLGEPQTGVVGGHRLEGNVGVPLVGALFLATEPFVSGYVVNLSEEFGGNGADCLVWITVFSDVALAVEDGVDV